MYYFHRDNFILKKNTSEQVELHPKLSRFDELVSIITKSNTDFAKASLANDARIECKVINGSDIHASLEKLNGKIYLHLPVKMRILSKGTKASLILTLGMRVELCLNAQDSIIAWCNYKFSDSKTSHIVKSSNCDGVSDADLIDFFFTCVSASNDYPFDHEIQALMDYFSSEAQKEIMDAYSKFTYVQPIEPPTTNQTEDDPEYLDGPGDQEELVA